MIEPSKEWQEEIPIRQETDPHGFFGKYQGAPGAEGPYASWVISDGIKEMWTDEIVDEVERAGSENSQLDHGVWVPTNRRIPDVVSKHLDKLLKRKSKPVASHTSDFSDFAPSTASDDIPF